jgi:mannose-1-phosphate guanylyltransferase
VYAVILAGGKGRRFWPLSRSARPKQYLDITGEGSMLSLTYRRVTEFIPPERLLLLTLEEQMPLVRDALPQLPKENIFAEPVGRNTAPSLAVAAEMVRQRGGDVPMLCCPADHLIRDVGAFGALAKAAAVVADAGDFLVTFGIKPDRPATGYGYIEAGDAIEERDGKSFLAVKRFHEKPDVQRAEEYVRSGNFYWNSGIFLWRPSVFLSAWSRYLPEGAGPLQRLAGALQTGGGGDVIREEYSNMPSISVDYGILEKTDNVLVTPADFDWSDVGSWDALFDILRSDGAGNVSLGEIEVLGSRGNLFYNPGGVTAAIGIEDIVLVANGTTILVCKRGESERVKELMHSIESKGKEELL